MCFAGGDDELIRREVLEPPPNRVDEIAIETPAARRML
jgi:hypothetical protein